MIRFISERFEIGGDSPKLFYVMLEVNCWGQEYTFDDGPRYSENTLRNMMKQCLREPDGDDLSAEEVLGQYVGYLKIIGQGFGMITDADKFRVTCVTETDGCAVGVRSEWESF